MAAVSASEQRQKGAHHLQDGRLGPALGNLLMRQLPHTAMIPCAHLLSLYRKCSSLRFRRFNAPRGPRIRVLELFNAVA